MANKLTLEHLAISMVNNCLIQYFDDEREILHNDCKIVELREDEMTITNREYQYDVSFDEVKPILRPLSDLTKEIEVNGEKFIPLEKLESMFGDCTKLTDTMLVGSFVPFGIVRKLFEWHFDVFGLIEKDLAIDINTL